MGCNCGGRARQAVTVYRLTLPNGVVRQYRTWEEADAANKRAGSVGTITAVTQ
ncbi:DUF7196 family protein [Streptomyces sp. 8N706]|uniref:DUF7196 family protein n=1 Tax=Streptomyces sp. 8N706 TaxID=3457416 RepID=UPI003FD581C2